MKNLTINLRRAEIKINSPPPLPKSISFYLNKSCTSKNEPFKMFTFVWESNLQNNLFHPFSRFILFISFRFFFPRSQLKSRGISPDASFKWEILNVYGMILFFLTRGG